MWTRECRTTIKYEFDLSNSISLFFASIVLEFVVLKTILKNPIHPPLGCFSHLRLTFTFSITLSYNSPYVLSNMQQYTLVHSP